MMKHKALYIGVVVGLATPCCSAEASNTESVYVQASAGIQKLRPDDGFSLAFGGARQELTTKFDSGSALAAAIGIAGEDLNVELEYRRLSNDIREPGATQGASDTIEADALFLNIWWPFLKNSRWQPAVGAGVGYIEADTDAASDNVLGIKAGAGLEYRLSDRLSALGTIEYLATERLRLNVDSSREGEFSVDYQSYSFSVGLRYRFRTQSGGNP